MLKMFPKTQDDTIDRLLRAQGGGAGKELPLCREFDADLANAYVERGLQASERASYENHLAACSPCRKAIVALTRMAQAEQASAHGVAVAGQARGTSLMRQWFGALTVPQWAMAAAAVVVLAVTLPLLLSHRSVRNDAAPAVAQESGPPASDQVARAMTQPSAPPATEEAPNPNSAHDANAKARAATGEKSATDEKNEAQGQQPAGAAGGVSSAAPALAQTPEPKPADQTAAKTEATTQPSAAPAAEPAKPQAGDVAKDQDKEKADAKANTGEKRADASSKVAETIAPPPPPPTRPAEPERRRERGDAPAGSLAIVPHSKASESAAATPGVTRKISGHQFLLSGGVWTDKAFDPKRDTPVTIIRDSDVYHSLLAKDAKIEPFLKGFPHNARVIFKFKGITYKLVPQDSDQ
jgi:hypothetical protein